VPAAQFRVSVVRNTALTGGYFQLDLEAGETTPFGSVKPGQFLMLRGDWGRDLINGRAFSLLNVEDDRHFSVLAKVFGRGTALLAETDPGSELTCTGPLGSHFPEPNADELQLLVAGGVGLPPMHFQARRAVEAGLGGSVALYYGGRGAEDIVLCDEVEKWGVELQIATEDGSRGAKGFVTLPLVARIEKELAAGRKLRILTCGPTPMLKAVRKIALELGVEAHLCLEEQMGCGFGVCLGCAVPVYGELPYKYCCTDGPVFDAREVRWP
jgi:dihydroorotate dehydrogenase electron transfer subunit